jgi:hypothetical protein
MIPGDSTGTARKAGLDHRLDAYFATLRSSSLRETLKRSVANWRIYAAGAAGTLGIPHRRNRLAALGYPARDLNFPRRYKASGFPAFRPA